MNDQQPNYTNSPTPQLLKNKTGLDVKIINKMYYYRLNVYYVNDFA